MIIRVPQCLFYLGKMVGDMFLRRPRDEINVGKKDRSLGNREKIERNTATGAPADTDDETQLPVLPSASDTACQRQSWGVIVIP